MERTATGLKFIGAILLAVAFLFPLSRCAKQEPPQGVTAVSPAAPAPESPRVYRYYYAWSDLERTRPWGWLFLLVFFWPAAFFAYRRFGASAAIKRVLSWSEPLLALGSAYWLYLRTFLRELWVGGYLAYAGLTLLLLGCAAAAAGALRGRRRPTPAP